MDVDGDCWAVWQGHKTYANVAHAIYGRWMPAWANTTATDVTVVSVETIRTPVRGESLSVRTTLHNPSFVPSSVVGAPFNVRYYLSDDATITAADTPLTSDIAVAALGAGQTRVVNHTLTLPVGTVARHQVHRRDRRRSGRAGRG